MSLGILGSGGVGPKRMLRFFGENCVGGESDWENRSDSNKSLVWSLLGRGPILFGVGLEAFLDQAVRNKNAYFFHSLFMITFTRGSSHKKFLGGNLDS